MNPGRNHTHGYICTQYRSRSWWTRRCALCGHVALSWQARAVVLWVVLCVTWALLTGWSP